MQEKKIITLKAVYGKQQGALLLSPVRDKITGRLKGVKELSEDERRKEARPVTADTLRRISDGLELKLDNAVDIIDWNWIKECGEIASSFDEAQSNPKALFYIDLPDKEIEERLARKSKRFEAESIIRNASLDSRQNLCRLMGQDVSYMSPADVEDTLLGKLDVKGGPDRIIAAHSDPKSKTKLFLFKLVDLKKITKRLNGMFCYGDIVIGLTPDAAVQWLDDPKNRDIVGRLLIETFGGDDTTPGSVIEEFEAETKAKALAEANKIVGNDSQSGKGAVDEDNQ